MDSSTSHNFQNQFDSGLLRFHSPPSSVSSNFTDTVNQINFESDRLVSRFMNSGGDIGNNTCFQDFEDKSSVHHGINNSQQKCSGLPPYYPGQSSAMDTLFEFLMDQNTQVKNVNSNLVRQSSSPAGLFAKLSAQNGHSTAKEVGNSGGFNGSNGEVNPSTNRLKSQLSFSARIPSSLGMLSKISKIESDSITGSPSKGKVGNGNGDAIFYSAGFLYGPWNDSSHFLENFTGMKRDQENDMKLLSSSQSGELGNCVHILSHQLTLPKTSAEIAALEKFFQFQDSVPCKIRAKRGEKNSDQ